MYKKIIGLFCGALMVMVVGCGSAHPPLTIVTGTVTYDGKPLDDATVALIPNVGDGTTKPASGTTDAQGNFTLTTTYPDGEHIAGAGEGGYMMLVSKYPKVEADEALAVDVDDDEAMEEQMTADAMEMEDEGPESLINTQFNTAYSTGTGWDNKCSVGAIESPTILKITLNSNGTGKIE
jgi:hypothetical protein